MVYNSIYDSSKPVYETIHQNLVLEKTLKPKFDSVQLKNHSTRYIDQPVHSTQLQSNLATTSQCSLRHSATGDQETILYALINVCVQGFVATGFLVWVGTHGQSRYVRELEGWDLSCKNHRNQNTN